MQRCIHLQLYGIDHMVKDHTDDEKVNPLLPLHGLHFYISSNTIFLYALLHIDRLSHTMGFVIPVVEHWLKQERYKDILPTFKK